MPLNSSLERRISRFLKHLNRFRQDQVNLELAGLTGKMRLKLNFESSLGLEGKREKGECGGVGVEERLEDGSLIVMRMKLS